MGTAGPAPLERQGEETRVIHGTMNGWNVSVEKQVIHQQNPDGPPGQVEPVDGWVLVFDEVIPRTGNTLRFPFGKDVRDMIVRELTGGIVLHGGELPKI